MSDTQFLKVGYDDPWPDEIRTINETTGGQKGMKNARMSFLPWVELMEVAELYNFGTQKYAPHNWRQGFDWGLSYDALIRHAGQFWEGEEVDAETQCSHLTSVVFHALALMYFVKHYPELDDRPNTVRSDS